MKSTPTERNEAIADLRHECGMVQPEMLVMLHEPWCNHGNALKAESEQAVSHLQREAAQGVQAMTPTLNTWCSPEVAKTWPEGSQVVWRYPFSLPRNGKLHGYGETGCHRPDWVGTVYPLNEPDVEFMLLELPL